MLELRLRVSDEDRWFRYRLDEKYRFNEVQAYIETQSRSGKPVRLLTDTASRVEFAPDVTPVVQLLCL